MEITHVRVVHLCVQHTSKRHELSKLRQTSERQVLEFKHALHTITICWSHVTQTLVCVRVHCSICSILVLVYVLGDCWCCVTSACVCMRMRMRMSMDRENGHYLHSTQHMCCHQYKRPSVLSNAIDDVCAHTASDS